MRAVIQRVSAATVTIDSKVVGNIGPGLLVLLGIEERDGLPDIEWLSSKLVNLRIFNDPNDIMNCSIIESGGDLLVVSQFTLHASTKKGNRPSYILAAKPEQSVPIYNYFIRQLEKEMNKPVETGEFDAMMDISLINSGPVTIIIDTKNKV